MFPESSLRVSGNAGIKMAFFILNDIDEPGFPFHAIMITIMDKIRIPFSEFTFSYARSSGAGGQHINKVNSKVIMNWNLELSPSLPDAVKRRFKEKYRQFILDNGEVQIMSQKSRSQKDNIDDCIEKLHAMINEVRLPPKIRKATKPKRSAVLKRLTGKKKDSDKKRMRSEKHS